MSLHRLSSADKIALEKLRGQVISARRLCHSQIQNLDKLWCGFPGEIAALPASQRAIRLEVARRQIAQLAASIPASPQLGTSPLNETTQPPGDQLAT